MSNAFNDDSFIRVLDVPGFSDSTSNNQTTVQRNAALIQSVGKIQKEFKIRIFNVPLYVTPMPSSLQNRHAETFTTKNIGAF